MKIRLENGETLDFMENFKLSLTLNNPMLTEQGSMSLPIVLPDSNRRKLGFPNRIDQAYKVKRVFKASVQSGSYLKPALLRTTSHEKGTVGAIYLNESEMYAKMKEVELSQAFDIVRPANEISAPGNWSDPLDGVIKYMELVMLEMLSDDFLLFPVATDYYTVYSAGYNLNIYQVLNEPMTKGDHPSPGDPDVYDTMFGRNKYHKLASRFPQKYMENGKEVNVPKGYGITPFLRQSYVLRRIFQYFGYELRPSIFDTDPQMKSIVVLNNTADAIVKGNLNYAQLVPSGTINDYLETVRTDYGCEFFVTPDHKYVEVKFWNDLLDNKDYIRLDNKIAGKEIITHNEPKHIKLSAQRGIEYTSTNFDTLEKFERNFGPLKYRKTRDFLYPGEVIPDGFYFIQREGDIWERYKMYGPDGYEEHWWRYHSKYLFDYYHDEKDMKYDTHDSNRSSITNVLCRIKYSYGNGDPAHFFPGYVDTLLFIGGRRHLNTVLASSEFDVITSGQKNDKADCPVMTAFYRGIKTSTFESPLGGYMVYGNTIKYDYLGEPIVGGFNLMFGTSDGLYEKFWKKYAEILRHSFNQIEIPLKLNILDILGFRFDNIYHYKGQPLLPEKLEIEIDHNDRIKIIKALFRTIRLYWDVDS